MLPLSWEFCFWREKWTRKTTHWSSRI